MPPLLATAAVQLTAVVFAAVDRKHKAYHAAPAKASGSVAGLQDDTVVLSVSLLLLCGTLVDPSPLCAR